MKYDAASKNARTLATRTRRDRLARAGLKEVFVPIAKNKIHFLHTFAQTLSVDEWAKYRDLLKLDSYERDKTKDTGL